jgi:hypothetical protein
MKILAALVLCLAIALAPYTVKVELGAESNLPWSHFADTVHNVVNVSPGVCADEQILSVHLEVDGRAFMYFAAENGRYLFAEIGVDKPVRVWVGVQLPSPEQDKIKIVDEHVYSEDRDGSGPCGHLFPKTS